METKEGETVAGFHIDFKDSNNIMQTKAMSFPFKLNILSHSFNLAELLKLN